MPLITWKEEYSVNIVELDEQHKQLIGLINELHEAMEERKAMETLDGILAKLVDYTVYHFSREENLMRVHGFPGYDSHREKHLKMTDKVLALQEDFKRGKTTISLDVMSFLKIWLKEHIMGTDKNYSAFLNGKGVK